MSKRRKREFESAEMQKFASEYAATDLTVKEIAQMFNISLRTLHYWRRAMGLERRRDKQVYVERVR